MPIISIIIPAFNARQHIRQAVESMLSQRFDDFELLVIDDGSNDNTLDELTSLQDSRLRLLTNSINQGVSYSLNRGIGEASGRYIARMDADDLSEPTRLEKQFEYMEKYQEVGVSGTWVTIFGDHPSTLERSPVGKEIAKAYLLFDNPLFHPSVIIRRSALDDLEVHYDSNFSRTEDYDLWSRIAQKAEIDNIPSPLVKMRHHQQSVTHTWSAEMTEQIEALLRRQLRGFGLEIDQPTVKMHHNISRGRRCSSKEDLKKAVDWLALLRAHNLHHQHYSITAFDSVLGSILFRLCRNSTPLGFSVWKTFKSFPYKGSFSPTNNELVRCFLSIMYHRFLSASKSVKTTEK